MATRQKPSSSSSNSEALWQLPKGYKPGALDILCGRGKGCSNHDGNKIFSAAVLVNLPRYADAEKRIDKSIVVSSVVASLREKGAQFLKFDNKTERWYEIGDKQAREKAGHAIRDVLSIEGKSHEARKRKRNGEDALGSGSSTGVVEQKYIVAASNQVDKIELTSRLLGTSRTCDGPLIADDTGFHVGVLKDRKSSFHLFDSFLKINPDATSETPNSSIKESPGTKGKRKREGQYNAVGKHTSNQSHGLDIRPGRAEFSIEPKHSFDSIGSTPFWEPVTRRERHVPATRAALSANDDDKEGKANTAGGQREDGAPIGRNDLMPPDWF
jgi:hypothetical protein